MCWYKTTPSNVLNTHVIILNPGSLSSEDFLIWACLIEKGSSYLQLQTPTLNTRVSTSLYQSMTICIKWPDQSMRAGGKQILVDQSNPVMVCLRSCHEYSLWDSCAYYKFNVMPVRQSFFFWFLRPRWAHMHHFASVTKIAGYWFTRS